MSSVSFLPSHHDPHCSPLSCIDWFNDSRNFINKTHSSCYVIKHLNISDLLPRHWSIFEQFVYGVRSIFESSQEDSFISAILSSRKIGMVFDDFSQNLGRKCLFLCLDKAVLFLLGVFFVVELSPSASLFFQHLLSGRNPAFAFFLHHSYKLYIQHTVNLSIKHNTIISIAAH